MAQLHQIILASDSSLIQEWKWDVPVWTQHGNILAAVAFKEHVKINFLKGASLDDPHHLFNAGLDAKATRAIDFHEHDTVDASALQELIRAAVLQNNSNPKTEMA